MDDKELPLDGSRGSTHPSSIANSEVEQMRSGLDALVVNLERVVVGKRSALDLVVTVLLAGGHLLLQTFKRIQATPDLLPSDITGGMVYDGGRGTLRFVPGPLFANVVLADELNRATR